MKKKLIKFFSLFLAIALIFVLGISNSWANVIAKNESRHSFTDVGTDNEFYDYITYLSEEGITTGYTSGDKAGSFGVNEILTRRHAAMFVTRALGIELPKYKGVFSDIKKSDSGASNIQAAYDLGIIKGYLGKDGKTLEFRPDAQLKRSQIAKIIAIAYNLEVDDKKTVDLKDIKDNTEYKYIKAVLDNGLVTGYPDKTFRPNNSVSRSHISKFIYKAKDFKEPAKPSVYEVLNLEVKDATTIKVTFKGLKDKENLVEEFKVAEMKDGSNTITFKFNNHTYTETVDYKKGPEATAPSSPITIIDLKSVEITGNATYSETLTAKVTPEKATVKYQWHRKDNSSGEFLKIEGATESTYTLTSADTGQYIKVLVTGEGRYKGKITREATDKIAKAPAKELAVESYEGVYDGQFHSIKVSNTQDGDILEYSTDNGQDWTPTKPEFKDVKVLFARIPDENLYDREIKVKVSNPNYLARDVVTTKIIITPKPIRATATADDKIYDGNTTTTGTYSLEQNDILSKDTVSVNNNIKYTFNNKNVSEDNVVDISNINLLGEKSSNYILKQDAPKQVRAKITPKEIGGVVTIEEKIYDGKTTAKGTYTLNQNEIITDDDVNLNEGITYTFNSKDVKEANIVTISNIELTGDNAENYTLNSTASATANIIKKELTATATADDKIYDGNTNTLGNVTLSGVLSGEVVTPKGTFTFNDKDAGTGKTVNVSNISLEGADAENYTLSAPVTTTANITSKPVEIIVDNPSIEYGSKYPTFGGTVLDLVTPEDLGSVVYKEIIKGKNSDGHLNASSVAYTGLTVEYANNGNYKVKVIPGALTVNRKEVTITADSKTFTYDGSLKSSSGATVEGLVASGESIEPTIVGSINYPTQSPVVNKVDKYALSLTNANNYIINKVNGELRMEKANIALTITADDEERIYDGKALEKNTYKSIGTLGINDSLVVNIEGSITDAGSVTNIIKDVSVINNGTTDVTENYDITNKSGLLSIKPAKVTITASTMSKTYDGKTLKPEYSVDGLVGTDKMTAILSGAIKDVGTSKSKVGKHTLTTSNANNYYVDTVEGDLTINPIKITLTAGTSEKTYDGSPLTDSTITQEGSFVEGEGLENIIINTSITNAGSINNEITGYKLKESTNYNNYKIEYKPGKLTVKPRKITLKANSESKTYNSIELKNSGYIKTGEFVAGEGVNVSVKGSQTNAGQSANQIKIDYNSNTNKNNYDITLVNGTLTVIKADHDMRGVTFEGRTATYSGNVEKLEVKNLPNGVNVLYENNDNKYVAGSPHTVTAKFKVLDSVNYNEIIETKSAELTISSAPFTPNTNNLTIIIGKTPSFTNNPQGRIDDDIIDITYKLVDSNNNTYNSSEKLAFGEYTIVEEINNSNYHVVNSDAKLKVNKKDCNKKVTLGIDTSKLPIEVKLSIELEPNFELIEYSIDGAPYIVLPEKEISIKKNQIIHFRYKETADCKAGAVMTATIDHFQ